MRLFFIVFLISSLNLSAQDKLILDTLSLETDSIVIYHDKSWEYLSMLNFNGILNVELDSFIKK